MSGRDFDIDSLAVHLHLSPQQVARMADRGKLPGCKIGGQWRFREAEIRHWLEERIRLSDEEQLPQAENVLERRRGEMNEGVSITRMLPIEAVAVPLQARTRNSVIDEMAALAARTGLLWDPERMAQAVRERENLHPTAIDIGVAVLHPRRPLPNILAEPCLALGRTHQGIRFGEREGGLTDVFFLICEIDDLGSLRTLARLSRLLSDVTFLDGVRCCEDAGTLHDWLALREAELFGVV
jgi:PTS system nitrogen regulatory IIA component